MNINTRKVRLAKPNINKKDYLLDKFRNIIDSGFFTQSKYVGEFEKSVETYIGVKYCVAVSSGTAALHIALLSLGIGHGDEVIVPAFTFPATVNVIELVNAKPVFVDVDLDSYNIKLNDIESKITFRTKAIIVVHLFGNPVNMDRIMYISQRYSLPVIEDAAGALGSTYEGKKCGSFGNISCFSFHPRKLITTGEGGMACTNDEKLAEKLRILRNHGMSEIDGTKDFIEVGFNYRMNEFEAVMGMVQMNDIEKFVSERIKIVEQYKIYLKNIPGLHFQRTKKHSRSSHQAFVLHHCKIKNLTIIEELRSFGIESTVGGYGIHMLSYYKNKYGYKNEDFPNAKYLHEHSFAIPIYNGMKNEDINYVAKVLGRVIRNGYSKWKN